MKGRRTYLKRTGLALLGLTLAPHSAAASARKQEPMSAPAMIIDRNRCMGCHSCVIACKEQNRTPQGLFSTWITKEEHGRFPFSWQNWEPHLCAHCSDAPCVAACDTGATFSLENGIVVVDWEQCNSCGSCVTACPFDARFLDPEHGNRADKCDFCLPLLEQGLEPSCVEGCPAKARVFGDLHKPEGEFAALLSQLSKTAPDSTEGRKGRVLYTTARKG